MRDDWQIEKMVIGERVKEELEIKRLEQRFQREQRIVDLARALLPTMLTTAPKMASTQSILDAAFNMAEAFYYRVDKKDKS